MDPGCVIWQPLGLSDQHLVPFPAWLAGGEAALSLFFIPFGTIIGILVIIYLTRPEVRDYFVRPLLPPPFTPGPPLVPPEPPATTPGRPRTWWPAPPRTERV